MPITLTRPRAEVHAYEMPTPPDPEVVQQAKRRRFSAEYKARIVAEADACKESGQIGALLRREGLYSSHLAEWRHQNEQGRLGRRRGPKPADPMELENVHLKKENAKLQQRLAQAELVIDVQKKLSELLGIKLADQDNESSN